MANIIDPSRHLAVFDPRSFNDRVDIIGAGATGSYLALGLAKLGVEHIRVIDGDVVAEHNIANQCFEQCHIGQAKVAALADVIKRATGCEIDTVMGFAPGDVEKPWAPYVFLLTDTMASRKTIMADIEAELDTRCVIETRMGADLARVYVVNPAMPSEVERWSSTLVSDDDAEASPCGATTTVGPTVYTLAGIALWQFIRYHGWSLDASKFERPEHELIYGLNPFSYVSTKW
jgi:hypothetical protein